MGDYEIDEVTVVFFPQDILNVYAVKGEAMDKNKYNIETVEVYYNGDEDKFDAFLRSVIRDYLSADKVSPDDKKSA